MKPSLTPSERLQLVGLLHLAAAHYAKIEELELAARELLGVTPADEGVTGPAHEIGDAVWNREQRDADALLKTLHVTVASGKPASRKRRPRR